jgi:hypothetical protein
MDYFPELIGRAGAEAFFRQCRAILDRSVCFPVKSPVFAKTRIIFI